MGTIPITLAFTKTDDSKPALIAATDGYDREFYEGTLKDHKDHTGALRARLRNVLAEFGPGHDVEERRGLFPLVGLAVLPPAVDGDAEVGDGLPARSETQLGGFGDVSNDGDGGDPVREFVIDVDMDAEPASEPTPNLLLRFRVQGGTLSLTGAYFVDIWTIEAIESVGPFSDEQVVTRRLALDVDTVAAAFGPVPLESVVVA